MRNIKKYLTKQTSQHDQQMKMLTKYVSEGYRKLRWNRSVQACDAWLRAWDLVKELSTPKMKDLDAFADAYPGLREPAGNWFEELNLELHNAGLEDAVYSEYRLQYVREFIGMFPKEEGLIYLNMRRGEGEALWKLGRIVEAEARFGRLVEEMPDEAWAYISWADHYWLYRTSPKNYEQAETIMERALQRPRLNERYDVLERMEMLYEEWEKEEQADIITAELDALLADPKKQEQKPRVPQRVKNHPPPHPLPITKPVEEKLGRNDPCWCGSGRKYKHCHQRVDRS